MTLDLTSCRLKLGRAGEHIDAIENDIAAWSETKPYTLVRECNAEATRYSVRVRVQNDPPFDRWSLIAGDCIHDLRCSLDHLVYASAIYETQTDPPPNHTSLMFPICDSRTIFDKSAPQRMGNLSDPVRAEIERLQPYNRPHEKLPPVLSVLRDLNNSDKHRLVNLTMGVITEGQFHNMRNFHVEKGQPVKLVAHVGSVKDGTELASITLDRATPNVEYDFFANIAVAVRHATGPKGQSLSGVTDLLKILRTEIENVVHSVERVPNI